MSFVKARQSVAIAGLVMRFLVQSWLDARTASRRSDDQLPRLSPRFTTT